MKEAKAKLIRGDMEYVAKRIKVLLNTLDMELNDNDFDESDIQNIVLDLYSILTSTAKRIAKEHELEQYGMACLPFNRGGQVSQD